MLLTKVVFAIFRMSRHAATPHPAMAFRTLLRRPVRTRLSEKARSAFSKSLFQPAKEPVRGAQRAFSATPKSTFRNLIKPVPQHTTSGTDMKAIKNVVLQDTVLTVRPL